MTIIGLEIHCQLTNLNSKAVSALARQTIGGLASMKISVLSAQGCQEACHTESRGSKKGNDDCNGFELQHA